MINSPKYFKRALMIAAALWLVALIAEVTIFVVSPNELLGWGERPALRPDPKFGWRLIESQTTRLRWQGYDYVVTSNSLGFPGPKYPAKKSSSVYRVMTVGGGFTSAEGVDTAQAWPRLLELILNQRGVGQTVEVLNFAVTGYGPSQYAAVVEEYGPVYEPDVILVTLIPNDFRKATVPISTTAQNIGFDRTDPNGMVAILTCRHLLQSLRSSTQDLAYEFFLHGPNPHGYALGQVWAFEKGQDRFFEKSQSLLEERLSAMRTVSERIGSEFVLLFIPASVQVCSPSQLSYFPNNISLDDAARFDMNQPQQRLAESAARVGVEHVDLRVVFDQSPGDCQYHPDNLHWTAGGHQAIARFIARYVSTSMGKEIQEREVP